MRHVVIPVKESRLLTLSQALDYPGSYGALFVEEISLTPQRLVPRRIILKQEEQYCFIAIGGTVGKLLDREEVEAYAKFIRKTPDGPHWLALVG